MHLKSTAQFLVHSKSLFNIYYCCHYYYYYCHHSYQSLRDWASRSPMLRLLLLYDRSALAEQALLMDGCPVVGKVSMTLVRKYAFALFSGRHLRNMENKELGFAPLENPELKDLF